LQKESTKQTGTFYHGCALFVGFCKNFIGVKTLHHIPG
jgi:hypothetical protein